ncbi:MAG TPA: Ig-like domain-containing protein [Solirubrobacteraceae bacterium]|nr:Ig-like domain-containing protein [Solirubrobacteraceae bacterium]
MTTGRNIARAAATALAAIVVLIAALQGSALAAAPELVINQPLTGSAINQQTPVFRGTTSDIVDPVTLQIYVGETAGGGSPVQTLFQPVLVEISPTEASWEITPASLAPGRYTAVVEQTNAESVLGVSLPVTFTVESAPVVTLTSPVGGAVLKTSEPTLTGAGGADPWDGSVTVAIHAGSSLGGSVAASESVSVNGGTWSFSPHLSDGVYTAQATQSDELADTGTSAAVTFTVDTTAPVVTLTSPVDGAVLTTSEPTLTGAGGTAPWDKPVAVAIHEGSSLAGPVVPSGGVSMSGGAWSYSLHLSDGVYTVRAEQGDEAGNTGTSAAVTFTVDTTAPVVTLTSPVGGAVLKTSEPTLTGAAATAPWDDQSVTVAIHEGGSAGGPVVRSGSVSVGDGTWSYAPHLSDGVYTAQAKQDDEAGHSSKSNAVTFTIDTTPPAVSLKKPANHADLAVSEPVFSGLAGHASGDKPSITLKIYEDEGSAVSGSPVQEVKELMPNAAYEWSTGSTGPRLSNGIYVAVAEQADEAGNIGTSKATFTIDTKSPEVTLDTSGFVMRGTRLMTGPTPSFSGTGATESEDGDVVSVNVYSGTSASGAPVRTVKGPLGGSAWTTPSVEALPDGTYTAQAEQTDSNPFSQIGVSNTATFTVEADQPNVTLTSPSSGGTTTSSTLAFSGAAGTGEGDLPAITVQLYSGSTIAGQTPLEAITVQASGGIWSAVFGGLSPGTYTARAEQEDDVGNVGHSEPVMFTVLAAQPGATVAPSPPVAAFKWIPSNPQTGEPVTLASSSSDGSSPITGYSWALAGNGVFTAGESTVTTSFSTPGPHVVQLRVSDANGLSSTVAETIAVASAPVPLMQPFPVVRMSGSFGASGARIGLLAALAPVGSTVAITCHGRGCPAKSQAFVAASPSKSKTGTATVVFRRFERFLRAGVVLEIRISKQGQIGKFTRFVIHRGKSPSRVDECLSPAGTTPLVCPS